MATAAIDMFRMGLFHLQAGDLESAREALISCLNADDPEWSPRAAAMLGNELWEHGDPQGAEPVLRRAIEYAHPDWSADARLVLGVIHASRGDVPAARQEYEKVIAAAHPQYTAHAWFNLGTLYQQNGPIQDAVAAFRAAVATNHPEFAPKAALNLGFVLFTQLADHAGARTAFRTVLTYSDAEQATLARTNLMAMDSLTTRDLTEYQVRDDQIDVSTGDRSGATKWRRWSRGS